MLHLFSLQGVLPSISPSAYRTSRRHLSGAQAARPWPLPRGLGPARGGEPEARGMLHLSKVLRFRQHKPSLYLGSGGEKKESCDMPKSQRIKHASLPANPRNAGHAQNPLSHRIALPPTAFLAQHDLCQVSGARMQDSRSQLRNEGLSPKSCNTALIPERPNPCFFRGLVTGSPLFSMRPWGIASLDHNDQSAMSIKHQLMVRGVSLWISLCFLVAPPPPAGSPIRTRRAALGCNPRTSHENITCAENQNQKDKHASFGQMLFSVVGTSNRRKVVRKGVMKSSKT